MLLSLIRNLPLWRLNSFAQSLLDPALILAALVALGHSTGLIAPPG